MNDVIDSLRELRTESPLDESFVGRAKNDFLRDIDRRPSSRSIFPARRWVAVVLAGAAFAAAVLVFALPGAEVTQQATAADLRNVANVAAAADPPPARLGRGQYVLTRYRFVASMTTTYTQEKLDRLSRERYKQVTNNRGHIVYPKDTPQSKIDRQKRLQRAWEERIKKGVRLEDLPARSVTIGQSQGMVEWINERHIGAGGGLPGNKSTYGDSAQRGTVKRLERAGLFAAPSILFQSTMFSGPVRFENFTWPSKQLMKLPTDPQQLERDLRSRPLPSSPLVRDKRSVKNDEELFHVAVGLLRSPFATPQLRSAVVTLLGGLEGVQLHKDSADASGRRGLGLILNSKPVAEEVVFDERSSQVLGVNFTIEDPSQMKDAFEPSVTISDHATYAVVFEPTIVVRGEPTCHVDLGHDMKGSTYCEKHVRPVTAQNTAD